MDKTLHAGLSMMRANEWGDNLIVCAQALADFIASLSNDARRVYATPDLVLLDFGEGAESVSKVLASEGVSVSPRYLDRFRFAFVGSAPDQQLLTSFFGLIADHYEELVDIIRNQHNIRVLLGFIEAHFGTLRGHRLVDFGCGVGLSAGLLETANCELIGFDICPEMRLRAAARGMTVWGHAEFARQPAASIDGAFASYVFHLLPPTGSLHLLWSRLRPGGIFVANLHKNQGYDNLVSFATAVAATPLGVTERESHREHGRYVGYLKDSD